MSDTLTAIDLFCGAGGLSLGLLRAGFEVRAAVDNDEPSIESYRANIGDHAIKASVTELTPSQLLIAAGLRSGECTLLAGGPPCQGFSVKRRGDRNDPRNELLLDFFRFVEEIQPRAFLIENVKGLLSKHGRPHLDELLRRALEDGYVCQVGQLDAADFGIPQFRERAFIVGFRREEGVRFRFPQASVLPGDRATVRQAIGDLPTPPADGSPHPDFPNHYREARLSVDNIARIRAVPEGGGRRDLPEHLQLPCHRRNPKLRHVDVYGRLTWDEPSVTLTARFDSFTRGRFGHPTDDRSLTLREGARLQTFPDSFVFHGNREEGARQIGNAVPPDLACVLALAIRNALENRGSDPGEDVAPKPVFQGTLF